jgi:hypothetical protein
MVLAFLCSRTSRRVLFNFTYPVRCFCVPQFEDQWFRNCGSLDVSQAYGPPWPVTGIALSFTFTPITEHLAVERPTGALLIQVSLHAVFFMKVLLTLAGLRRDSKTEQDERKTTCEWLTLKSVTPSPTSSTSPAHSNPRMKGVLGGESMAPWRTIKSWKLSPLKPETHVSVSCLTGITAAANQPTALRKGTNTTRLLVGIFIFL